MEEAIRVRVLNYEKFNPRKDVTTSSWVRFEHNFFTHPDFLDFTVEERLVWIYVLCHASMKSCYEFELSVPHFIHVTSMSSTMAKKAIHQALAKLQRRQIVRIVTSRGRYADVTSTCSTNERTDERDERDVALIAARDEPPPANPVKFYCDLWKARNGKSPDIRGKEAGQLTKLVKDVGWDRAQAIMRAYFAMPDPFFIKRGYDVGTMLLNLAAIAQFEASGKVVTKQVVEQIEKQVDKIQGTKKRRSIAEIEAEQQAMRSEGQLALGGRDVDQA